jgi:hypothetical protein
MQVNAASFTAEASLYKTSGHYRTGRHALNLSPQMISMIYPARDVVIEVGGCLPGTYKVENPDGTYDCWTNPDPWRAAVGAVARLVGRAGAEVGEGSRVLQDAGRVGLTRTRPRVHSEPA